LFECIWYPKVRVIKQIRKQKKKRKRKEKNIKQTPGNPSAQLEKKPVAHSSLT
jgi:hypothetical protein